MKTLRTTTHVGPAGALHLSLPTVPEMAGEDVDVLIVLSPIAGVTPTPAHSVPDSANKTNGRGFGKWQSATPPHHPPSDDERRRLLDKAVGSIDDPTFLRPPQGEFQAREPLD